MNDKFQIGLFLKLAAYCVGFAAIFSLVLVICSSPGYGENAFTPAGAEGDGFPAVIIDPGHGGEDGGAVSASGIPEKNINLNIAKYLAELCRASGIECRLTRSEDVMLYTDGEPTKKMQDLNNRVKFTEGGGCIFVSIHQNKFPQTSCRGTQVYYSKNDPDSAKLAETVRSYVVCYLQNENERMIKKAGSEIYVLDRAEVPAILVECGFLSNPQDLELLTSSEYQKGFACVLYSAILDHLSKDAS